MTRTFCFILLALPVVAGCTITGDALNPPRELKAHCSIADADPVPQTGLATSLPLSAGKL